MSLRPAFFRRGSGTLTVMVASPTQRTLQALRKQSYIAAVVEKWNAHARIRQDLFGCIDVLGCNDEGIIGIQATTKPNARARLKKAWQEPRLAQWLRSGARFEVWGWHRMPNGRWHCQITPVSMDDLTSEAT